MATHREKRTVCVWGGGGGGEGGYPGGSTLSSPLRVTKDAKQRTHLDQSVVAHPQACEVVEGLVVTELDVVDMTIPARVQRVVGVLGGGGVRDGSLEHLFSEHPQMSDLSHSWDSNAYRDQSGHQYTPAPDLPC